MKYTGTGKIQILGLEYESWVELDPQNGIIQVRIPQKNDLTRSLIGNNDIFNDSFEIKDFKCILPYGNVTTSVISNLHLTSIRPGTWSVFDSSLVRSFTLDNKETGISSLIFKPKRIVQQFVYNYDNVVTGKSELIFYNHKIKQIASFQIGRKKINIDGDTEYLILNSNNNLLSLRQELENALSVLQGGRTFYRTGFYKNRLELSFQKIIKEAIPYGLIFHEEKEISKFLSKYLEYIESLSTQQRTRFNLFISYLLDSCSQIILLENRAVNLYIALEIIDKSRTLNKDSLKKLLSIESNDAELIIRIRNGLIHHGESLKESIKSSKAEIRKHFPKYRLPFKSNLARKLPGNFYFYLLTKTYQYILKGIGVNNHDIYYTQYY